MDHRGETGTLSRATSISRASGRSSTRSRSQSLIRKNVQASDLKPSDILIERFVAWKAIVKQLIAYFEGIADIQNNTARELTKLGAVIQVPFRAGNQFLGEGGLQDVFYSVRDKTRIIADQHANLGRTVDSSIVQHLVKLRSEIKAHIKNIQNDTGKLATSVAKERELSTKLIAELTSSVSSFKNTPMNVTHKTDPYVANTAVLKQLQTQVHEENLLQKSIIIMQQNSAHFEEGIVRALQSAWQTYDEWQARMSTAVADVHRGLGEHFASLAPDREWISFSARSDHLLDPDTPLRNVEHIKYPMMEDAAVLPVHTGMLERKKRFTRTYREAYYVLTPAGFLHEYPTSDPTQTHSGPSFSLFLPACTLGPPSSTSSKSHKFHIEHGKARQDTSGLTKFGSQSPLSSLKNSFSSKEGAYTFRCRSREEVMEWWNDVRMLCARYLVASEIIERTGPVVEAVRGVGYDSDELGSDIGSDEEEMSGSSAEEEDEDEMYATDEGPSGHGAGVNGKEMAAEPPSYSRLSGAHNTTAADKKVPSLVSAHDHGVPDADDEPSGEGPNVSRRPSTKSSRAQEKMADRGLGGAGEGGLGTDSAAVHNGTGPGESKFQERL